MSSIQTTPEGAAALAGAIAAGLGLFTPPPPLTLSEWADRFAYLSRESSAQPGKFQTSSAEYQRGIQDAITDPAVQTVVMMMCAQSGKSQIQLNTIGYYSHHDPSPMMLIQASIDEAEKFSKNRVAKMIRDTPVLKSLYPEARSRDSGNTLLNKEFLGGVLTIAGANAPAGLASKPIRILIPDEVDRYPESAGTEGDPVDLASKRTTTFWNKKIILASTPGIKGLSRIEAAYTESDQRRFFVPCWQCEEMQILEWGRLKYKLEGEKGRPRVGPMHYVCVNGCEILERAKYDMVRHGEWRATARSSDGKTAGFHLNALYSPWVDWQELVTEWLKAQHGAERMKTFLNTRLAETWEIRGDGAEQSEIEKRVRISSEILPEWVLMLTAGVDVQKDRIECSIRAEGLDRENGIIEHRIFRGDPSLPEEHEASPWRALDEFLQQRWLHSAGIELGVACTLIDSGGHHTKQVYDFTRRRELRKVYACKGHGGIGKPLVSTANRVGPMKTLLFGVGVDTAKERVYTSIRVEQPGPGYCHFAKSLEGEYFRQLTSEQLVTTVKNNQTTMKWIKKYERNEALDCFNYALAAVEVLRPNFAAIRRNLLLRAAEVKPEQAEEHASAGEKEKPAPQRLPILPRQSFTAAWNWQRRP